MKLIIYGDFNCPYSCLASARANALVERGVADIEWRAVEHDPTIATPSAPVAGDAATMLEQELDQIRGLRRAGEYFPIRRPGVLPSSAAATAAFAAAEPVDADDVRQRLFVALWFDGRDICDRAVIDELCGSPPVSRPEQVSAWHDEWWALDRRVVPMLVLPDGYVSRGLGALQRLADLAADPGG